MASQRFDLDSCEVPQSDCEESVQTVHKLAIQRHARISRAAAGRIICATEAAPDLRRSSPTHPSVNILLTCEDAPFSGMFLST